MCYRFLVCLVWSLAGVTPAVAAVDLSPFVTANSGSWNLSLGNTRATGPVLNQANGLSLLVTPDDYGNHRFTGTWGVDVARDDDFIALVFGRRGDDYFVVDWSQGPHAVGTQGFRLRHICQIDPPNIFEAVGTIVDTFTGPTAGWEDNTVHTYDLTYSPDAISLAVSGGSHFASETTVISATPGDFGLTSFPEGQFGFGTLSQSGNFFTLDNIENLSAPVPEPSTLVVWFCLSCLVVGWQWRARKQVGRAASV